jgi:hypothetical protein
MAFLASVALCELILPGVSTIEGKLRNIELTHPLQSRSGQFLLGVLVLNLLFGMQLAVTEYSNSQVPLSVRQASEWIRSHTQAEDKFLVMTGVEGVLDDPVNEWFPVLTERQSITTVQGAEWLGNNIFVKKLPLLREIQRCKTNISPLQCADTLANTMDIEYDYIMYVFSDQQDRSNTALDVYEFSEFQVVYSSSDVLVLMRISSDTNPN